MKNEKSRLLIIDDESEIRSVLDEYLSRTYHCVAVESAEQALALLAEQPFDLILSDITMAQMSGLKMVPHILQLAPDSVVVMISGQRTIEFAIEAMRAGAFDYITKPFDLADVGTAVRRALDHLNQLRQDRSKPRHHQSASEADLARAVENQEFVVHYQPKVNVESRKPVGVEALVRWNHPHFGLMPPSDFITAAEDSGLIVAIGSLVLQIACAKAREWQDAGFAFHVAINISARQFEDGNLLDTIGRALDKVGLDANYLQLELTETSVMDNGSSVLEVLGELRKIGVKIAIDDFGTGYSSLSYLKRLPVDFVKLDQTFVRDATTNPDDAGMVMAIITLAHNLRLKVIAEGVETEEQLKLLRLLRCDEGQGFLFGRPVSGEAIANLDAQFNFARASPAQQRQLTLQ